VDPFRDAHFYVLNDADRVECESLAALAASSTGTPATVHEHGVAEECNDRCRTALPANS
jgi:hypothetical protein